MSLCDELCNLLNSGQVNSLDDKVFRQYIDVDEKFEQLVNMGIAQKRGYQLMSIANTVCNSIEINLARE